MKYSFNLSLKEYKKKGKIIQKKILRKDFKIINQKTNKQFIKINNLLHLITYIIQISKQLFS